MMFRFRRAKNKNTTVLKGFWRKTGGASVVEFALILPVFIAFVFGCIEFGMIMWGRISLEYATSQAARYAYVNNTASNSAVANYAATLVPANYPGHLVYSFTANMVANTEATITGNFTYNFFVLPLSGFTMTSTVVQPLPPS